jgi:hypothetical protein
MPELMRTPFLDLYQEYDLPTNVLDMPAPSPFFVFSGLHAEFNTAARLAVMKRLAELLSRPANHPGLVSIAAHIEQVLQPGLDVGSFGFMLSRNPLAVRINLGVEDFSSLTDFLKAASVEPIPESLEYAYRSACRFADGCFVALDFRCLDQEVSLGQRIGLELVFRRQGDPVAVSGFLDWLRVNKLCSDPRHDALANLQKIIGPTDSNCEWPDDMVVESILSPVQRLTTVAAYISHFKLVCCGAEPLEAKAYLAYRHELVSADSRQ